ncbi:MAG: hypothetical protein AAFQ94_29905 [Bacteroidota bacterium]
MKLKLIPFSILLLILCSCTNPPVKDYQGNKEVELQEIKKSITLTTATDSLIAELANMKTDTLDCSADIYWKIVGKGKSYIPKLIKSLTDTTPTNVIHGCKNEKLNIGELSYFALEEIGDFPASVVTQIQFDVASIKNGWSCWNFYDYLFDNRNKKEYQDKVKNFYEKSQFEYVEFPEYSITDCIKQFKIKGRYKWQDK